MLKNGYESFYFPGTDERPLLERLASDANKHLDRYMLTAALGDALQAGNAMLAAKEEFDRTTGQYGFIQWMQEAQIWEHAAKLCMTLARTNESLQTARRRGRSRK
jgi:hypothetical protein